MSRNNLAEYQENLFRPVFELSACYVWLAAGIFSIATMQLATDSNVTFQAGITVVCFLIGIKRLFQSIPLLKRQFKLFTNKLEFMALQELRKRNRAHKNSLRAGSIAADGKTVTHDEADRRSYLCDGFEWGAEHANRAHQIINMSSNYSEIQLPVVMRSLERKLRDTTRRLGGKPWIHGMGDSSPVYVTEDTWFGHSFIAGNVGTGKTTLFKLLSLSMLHMGHTLIIIDPKNDRDWRNAIKSEMDAMGMADKFYYFNPSNPSESIRLQPLKNFARHTEITERVASLQASEGANSFTEFGWEVINKAVEACLYIGEQPKLTTLQGYLTNQKGRLVKKCIETHFDKVMNDPNWRINLQKEFKKYSDDPTLQLIEHYTGTVAEHHPDRVVDQVISLVTHDAAHYQKMVVGLLPLFSVLNATPLDELISPVEDYGKDGDKRPIVDTRQILDNGGVLYMSLDSLSDSKSAGFLAKLILSDIAAAAGARYNFGGSDQRVSIFVDEVHAAVAGNDALLNLLAQGRAASMQCFLATQTIPDLEEKTSAAAAERFLGLCNNFISMRVNDQRTQEYVARNFGTTAIADRQVTLSANTDTKTGIAEYSGGYAERLTNAKDDAFPSQLLTDLPKLQFIARLADGRKIKGRIPIVK